MSLKYILCSVLIYYHQLGWSQQINHGASTHAYLIAAVKSGMGLYMFLLLIVIQAAF
jgi:hypothetical protein